MYRKYLDYLAKWAKDEDRKPLLVLGARQVGKSYLIEELFAKQYFKGRYLRIDCSDDPDFVNYVYANDSLQKVLDFIQLHYDFIPDKDHLLIFDEAQECLPIIQMMKHFCEKRRDIPLIVSGSLVRIKISRQTHKRGKNADKGFLFPVGKVNQLMVYPMTFDEFLYNYKKPAFDFVKDNFQKRSNLSPDLHKELMDIFADYLFVGGMPEVVQTFLKYKDNKIEAYSKVIEKLNELYTDYLSDMDLYQASKESIIRSRLIYKSIYSQLSKENKNFKTSQVVEKTKNRDVINPIGWLTTACVVNKSCLLKEKVSSPLIEDNESIYRLYLSDMGIFTFESGLNAKNFILDKDNALSGVFYENYISIELAARDYGLFYWKGKRDSEFEFVLDINSRIIPLDSKKNRGTLSSLAEFRNHNKHDIAIKVSANQYGYDKENQILTIPYYYFSFFMNELKEKGDLVI
ncbi:MAG: AAA family ATPase [Bacilli bacterium]|jgi:predicted AAA+ superfamily ATPase|nr:AAA family ATPase [Bacilli bacterium]